MYKSDIYPTTFECATAFVWIVEMVSPLILSDALSYLSFSVLLRLCPIFPLSVILPFSPFFIWYDGGNKSSSKSLADIEDCPFSAGIVLSFAQVVVRQQSCSAALGSASPAFPPPVSCRTVYARRVLPTASFASPVAPAACVPLRRLCMANAV